MVKGARADDLAALALRPCDRGLTGSRWQVYKLGFTLQLLVFISISKIDGDSSTTLLPLCLSSFYALLITFAVHNCFKTACAP